MPYLVVMRMRWAGARQRDRSTLRWLPAVAAAAAVSAGAAVAVVPGQVQASAPRDRSCADESYIWTGAATVGGPSAATVDTGVAVPVVTGTTLTVVGVSADGLDDAGRATALDVTVGGATATPGASVAGGGISISTTSAVALRVSGATVVVSRCAEVAVLPPVSRPLPATGVSEHLHLVLGASMVGAGALMVTAGRRRRAAR